MHTSTQKDDTSLARKFQKRISDLSHKNGVIDQGNYRKRINQRKRTDRYYCAQDGN